MKCLELLTLQHSDAWLRVLKRCASYDFYHLPQYHALAEGEGAGTARLFVYTEGEYTIALPLLLRSLDGIWPNQTLGRGWLDATSVYGYAGPVSSHCDLPGSIIGNFQSALDYRLRELGVVTVFSRLHPLFPQEVVLAGLGESAAVSQTVSIDLTLPSADQRSRFRRSHRESSNRLRRRGVTCILDKCGEHFDDFSRIYEETMRRVSAAEQYFFSPTYFKNLRRALETRLHLFVCQLEGEVICAGLFVMCQGIVQYHLGGTLNSALPLAPMKLLVDEVRQWATDKGQSVLHIGGGITPHPDDPLLFFKKGFSDRTHAFATWRWVVLPEIHQELCAEKARWNERHQCNAINPYYFPTYRCPTASCALPAEASILPEATVGGLS